MQQLLALHASTGHAGVGSQGYQTQSLSMSSAVVYLTTGAPIEPDLFSQSLANGGVQHVAWSECYVILNRYLGTHLLYGFDFQHINCLPSAVPLIAV